jgi:hypothetical protein
VAGVSGVMSSFVTSYTPPSLTSQRFVLSQLKSVLPLHSLGMCHCARLELSCLQTASRTQLSPSQQRDSCKLAFRCLTTLVHSPLATMATQGTTQLSFSGSNLGPSGTPITIRYTSTSTLLGLEGTCAVTSPHVQIQCSTAPGHGTGYAAQLAKKVAIPFPLQIEGAVHVWWPTV